MIISSITFNCCPLFFLALAFKLSSCTTVQTPHILWVIFLLWVYWSASMGIQGPKQLFYNYTSSRRQTINTLFTPLLHPGGLLVSKAARQSEGHRFNPCNSQSVHQQLCAQLECPWRWHCSLIFWLLFNCFKMELLPMRMISLSLSLTSMHV